MDELEIACERKEKKLLSRMESLSQEHRKAGYLAAISWLFHGYFMLFLMVFVIQPIRNPYEIPSRDLDRPQALDEQIAEQELKDAHRSSMKAHGPQRSERPKVGSLP